MLKELRNISDDYLDDQIVIERVLAENFSFQEASRLHSGWHLLNGFEIRKSEGISN